MSLNRCGGTSLPSRRLRSWCSQKRKSSLTFTDGLSLYVQERLGEVLGQGMEPGCIAGCEDEADHISLKKKILNRCCGFCGDGTRYRFSRNQALEPRLAIPVEIVDVLTGTDG